VKSDPIGVALETARKKLTELLESRAGIDKEIVKWKRVIDSLSALSDSEEESDPSDVQVSSLAEKSGKVTIKFTEGIRMVLRQNFDPEIPMSAPDIKEKLINLGFDFSKYAQPLVPIHNTLKRLEDQGEVAPMRNENGQILGYRWISPIERALHEEPASRRIPTLAEMTPEERAGIRRKAAKLLKQVQEE